MSRRKSRDPPFWQTGRKGGKTETGRQVPFFKLYADLPQDPAFYALPAAARLVYICMLVEARDGPEFEFSHGTAQRYGIADTTLRRAVDQLKDAGFIRADSGKLCHKSTRYRFIADWKMKPAPAAYTQPKYSGKKIR